MASRRVREEVITDLFPPMRSGENVAHDQPVVTGMFDFCYFHSHLRGEDMELLIDELRQQLPPIRKIHNPADDGLCMIYARFLTSSFDVTFYVAEGELRNSDYVFWGLLIAPQFKFPS